MTVFFKLFFMKLLPMYLMLPAICTKTIKFDIKTNTIIHQLSGKFLSIGLGTKVAFSSNAFDAYRSSRFVTAVEALSPCYIRVGGNSAEEAIFNISSFYASKSFVNEKYVHSWVSLSSERKKLSNFTVSAEDWDVLSSFLKKVKYSFIFDLNAFLRIEDDWDSSDALMLMKYITRQGYVMGGWELGNEPNLYQHYNHTIEAAQLAMDYSMLKSLVSVFSSNNKTQIIGPSVTHLTAEKSRDYFIQFLNYSKGDSITAATFHHYYVNGRTASLFDFLDPQILDSLITNIKIGRDILQKCCSGKKLWLGETSSAYGGGAKGLSDRYVAGFMWLDKLGIASKEGIDVVIRQTLIGGNYEMIDSETLIPNPDYWLSLLYKKLVGTNVLSVQFGDTSGLVRMYAHCANRENYEPGSVTLYWLNLDTDIVKINSSVFQTIHLHMYLLQPHGPESLKSKDVTLNGVHLQQEEDGTLPDVLIPQVVHGPVSLPPLTYGFLVIPGKNIATACA